MPAPPTAPTNPQTVAEALSELLPHRISIFHVELVQTTNGCAARARIGPSIHSQAEINGIGDDIETAIVDLGNAAREVAS